MMKAVIISNPIFVTSRFNLEEYLPHVDERTVVMTIAFCANPFVTGAGCGKPIVPREVLVSFNYKGLDFKTVKQRYKCEECAISKSKELFDKYSPKLLRTRKNNRELYVRWIHYRLMSRKIRGIYARIYPEADHSLQMIQVLHDVGILSRERGWSAKSRDNSKAGIVPNLTFYGGSPLFIVSKEEALAYAKVCLGKDSGCCNFELRNGTEVITDTEIFSGKAGVK